MEHELQEKAQRILDAAVSDGSENSLQFCAYRDGECIIDARAGWADFARTRPVDVRTVFPVYSTSKGVPAAASPTTTANSRPIRHSAATGRTSSSFSLTKPRWS